MDVTFALKILGRIQIKMFIKAAKMQINGEIKAVHHTFAGHLMKQIYNLAFSFT